VQYSTIQGRTSARDWIEYLVHLSGRKKRLVAYDGFISLANRVGVSSTLIQTCPFEVSLVNFIV